MKTIYIADDGTQFENMFECEEYEWHLNHTHLKDIIIYDKEGNRLLDCSADSTYNNSYKVIIPNEQCLKELHDLIDYAGFCEYASIVEVGTYIYKETGRFIGTFIKVPNRGRARKIAV